MKKIVQYGILVAVVSILVNTSYAVDCSQYFGTGYCVDYIQQRMTDLGLGSKPSGDAGTWAGGINANDVQVNDVAIFVSGTHGHVAWIDGVNGDSITLHEWNFSDQYTKSTSNLSCSVSDNFHVTTSRTISKGLVTRFWRPSGSSTIQVPMPYRRVGDLAWSPPNKSCHYADRWIFYQLGYPNGGQSIGLNSICQQEEYEMMMALGGIFSNWWNVIYSPSDLIDNGICSQ